MLTYEMQIYRSCPLFRASDSPGAFLVPLAIISMNVAFISFAMWHIRRESNQNLRALKIMAELNMQGKRLVSLVILLFSFCLG